MGWAGREGVAKINGIDERTCVAVHRAVAVRPRRGEERRLEWGR